MILYAMLPILIILQVLPMVSGEYCAYVYKYPSYTYNYRYCSNGCCGNSYSDYSDICCSSYSSIELSGGAIAGIVIGCLVVLFIVICCIVCCCAAANNSSRRTGTVIQPGSTGMQAIVVSSTAVSQGQSTFPVQYGAVGYGYHLGVQPPPYAQHIPASQESGNPAFPPPPPAKY